MRRGRATAGGATTDRLAAASLVLSMAGLYGVLSQVTMRQTREMGIRMALGATARRASIRRWP